MQLIRATRSCNSFVQFVHATRSCNSFVQLAHATRSCSLSVQLVHANRSCITTYLTALIAHFDSDFFPAVGFFNGIQNARWIRVFINQGISISCKNCGPICKRLKDSWRIYTRQVEDPVQGWLQWYPDKIPPKKCLWMPLSTNLFRLESSIPTRVKRATNQNNVTTEKRSYGKKKSKFQKIYQMILIYF